jgi:hypothetical protein
MKLKLERYKFLKDTTISRLYVDDKLYCYVLEDVDRGLDSKMSLAEIATIKVHSNTAIPTGTYIVANTYSPKYKKYLPLLFNVPGYKGIRIHPGNTHVDTAGCLLPGQLSTARPDAIINSRATFNALHKLITSREKTEKITIEIVRNTNANN